MNNHHSVPSTTTLHTAAILGTRMVIGCFRLQNRIGMPLTKVVLKVSTKMLLKNAPEHAVEQITQEQLDIGAAHSEEVYALVLDAVRTKRPLQETFEAYNQLRMEATERAFHTIFGESDVERELVEGDFEGVI